MLSDDCVGCVAEKLTFAAALDCSGDQSPPAAPDIADFRSFSLLNQGHDGRWAPL